MPSSTSSFKRILRLPRMPMLRFALRPWRDWLEAAGLPGDEPERGPIFQDRHRLGRENRVTRP